MLDILCEPDSLCWPPLLALQLAQVVSPICLRHLGSLTGWAACVRACMCVYLETVCSLTWCLVVMKYPVEQRMDLLLCLCWPHKTPQNGINSTITNLLQPTTRLCWSVINYQDDCSSVSVWGWQDLKNTTVFLCCANYWMTDSVGSPLT